MIRAEVPVSADLQLAGTKQFESWGDSMFPFWTDVPLSAWLQITVMFVAAVFWLRGLLAAPGRPQ
jgi:hypothetical protein